MRCRPLPWILLFCALTTGARGGNILIQNFVEDGLIATPVTFADGRLPVAGSGIAVVGGFRDESMLTSLPATRTAWASLLDGFMAFGSSAAVLGDANAHHIPGLYALDQSRQLRYDDPLIGKAMFTLIGNAPSLPESTSVLLLRHAEWFTPDSPIFGAMLFPHEPGVEVLLGNIGSPVTLPGFGIMPSSLHFVSLSDDSIDLRIKSALPVPEPSTLMLIALSGAWMLRRQRNASRNRP